MKSFFKPLQDYPKYFPLSEIVYNSLKEAILYGKLQPGQLISENMIAASLEVSRTPVREAFKRLEVEGLITVLAGRKATITVPTIQDIEDIYNTRLIIEVEALRRITAKDEVYISQLESCINKAEQCLANNDIATLGQINTEFHQVIVSALQNRRLEKFFDSLHDTISRYRFYSLIQNDWASKSEHEHCQIVQLLKQNNNEAAVQIMWHHLSTAKELVKRMVIGNKQF